MPIVQSAAAAKSLQSCPTLCNPTDGSPPGSAVPGILQARTLEWVSISFSNAWKWKVKVKSLSRVRLLVPHGLRPTRVLHPWDFPGKSTGVGCHCLLRVKSSLWLLCQIVQIEDIYIITDNSVGRCNHRFHMSHKGLISPTLSLDASATWLLNSYLFCFAFSQ